MKEQIRILVLSSKGHKQHSQALARRRGSGPFPGQKVQIGGSGELFVVLRIDRDRQVADLLRQGSVNRVETGIPLMLLTPVTEADAVGEVEASA